MARGAAWCEIPPPHGDAPSAQKRRVAGAHVRDPGNGPHPDTDPATYAWYKKIFALRKQFPALARGAVLLREAACDNPWVFTALRRLNDTTVFIAVSLSDKEETARVTPHAASLFDPQSGETLPGGAQLTLRPFQVLVGRVG